MLGEDQMPSFIDRERSIAHSILRTVLAKPEQGSFVAFVGREHLISVSRQMLHFLNKGDSFMGYKRPPQFLDDPKLETDKVLRKELLKRHSLCSQIYEDGSSGQTSIPFKHNQADVDFQKAYDLKYVSKLVLADTLGDIEGLGIEFGKEDFEKVVAKDDRAQQYIDEDKYLKEYLDKKGGKLKCGPMSYMQGNFAFYHAQKNEYIDNSSKESKAILDYSSGDDEVEN